MSRWGQAVAAVIALLSGSLLAIQTRLNGSLGQLVGDGPAAAAIVFAIGLVICGIGLLVMPRARSAVARIPQLVRAGGLPWWMLSGGAIASVFVIAQGVAGALLGTAVFTVTAVAGQTISGLVVDRAGIGPGGVRRLTLVRVLAGVICVAALILVVSVHLGDLTMPWLLLLPLIGGATIAWQQAVNGRVRVAADSALAATFVNFLTGAVVVAVVAVIQVTVTATPVTLPTEVWAYLGGVSAVVFIALTTVLVRSIGVLVLGLCTVAGQLLASLALDVLWPQAVHIDASILLATAAVIIAAVVAAVPWSKRSRVP